jgi:hypothetical protein
VRLSRRIGPVASGGRLAAAREKHGPGSTAYADVLYEQAVGLLGRGKRADAEPILRECLAIRRKAQPGSWAMCYTQSVLGDSLVGQQKYAEAEPLLVAGYEGLKAREEQIPRFYVRHHLA